MKTLTYIAEPSCLRARHDVWQNQISSVHAYTGRQEKADFFGESSKPSRGIARGCDQHARVNNTRELCILVVQIQSFLSRAVLL